MMQNPTNGGSIGGNHLANKMPIQLLRRRRRRRRQLQQSDNEGPAGIIPTNTVPDVPTTALSTQTYVALYWSMVLLPGESPQPEDADGTSMADWLMDDFLCMEEKVWMGNAMNLLRNDCFTGENTVDLETISGSHDIILWNKPTVEWYTDLLQNTEGVQYEVYMVQYPLEVEEPASTATTEEDSFETPQAKLQTLLEDQIRTGQLQSDRGVPSILGRELETYWLFRSSPDAPELPPLVVPGVGGREEPLDDLPGPLRPYNSQMLVIIGALLALIHTLGLLLLHFVMRPYLQKRTEKQRQQKSEQQQADMTGTSEEEMARSFLAPNYWLNGQQQQLSPHPHQRHFLEAPKTLLSAQMPDDHSHHSDLLSSIGYFSAEDEEDVEVFSLLSATSEKSVTKPLLDPPGQSSSPQRLLDPPESSSNRLVEDTNLMAPMASYFCGNNEDGNSQKSLPRSSRNNSQKSYRDDEDSIMVLHC